MKKSLKIPKGYESSLTTFGRLFQGKGSVPHSGESKPHFYNSAFPWEDIIYCSLCSYILLMVLHLKSCPLLKWLA